MHLLGLILCWVPLVIAGLFILGALVLGLTEEGHRISFFCIVVLPMLLLLSLIVGSYLLCR